MLVIETARPAIVQNIRATFEASNISINIALTSIPAKAPINPATNAERIPNFVTPFR